LLHDDSSTLTVSAAAVLFQLLEFFCSFPLEGTGPLTRRRELLSLLDEMSANYIQTRAERDRKTPAQVVADMVRHEIAAQAASTV
jgi:hypothetical protein